MVNNKKHFSNEARNSLNQIQENKLQEEMKSEKSLNEAIYANANRAYSSIGRDRRAKMELINESNSYYLNAFNDTVVDIVTDIVDGALVLDEDYKEINPEYKNDVYDILENIFNKGEINEQVNEPNMIKIFETVHNQTPVFETGKTLNEEDLSVLIEATKKSTESEIDNLVKDTQAKVVDTLSAEKVQAEEINKDLEKTLEEEFKGFVVETNKKSLFEMLCINDAKVQIQESGDYNSELAVSNGILMLTILEALKTTGLVDTVKEEKLRSLLLA